MTVSYGIHGWKAETYHDIGEGRQLKLFTMKRSNGDLATTAMAGVVDPKYNSFTYAPFSDFNRSLMQRSCRVTESRVREQHAVCLQQVPALILEAKAFYEAKNKSVSGTQESRALQEDSEQPKS